MGSKANSDRVPTASRGEEVVEPAMGEANHLKSPFPTRRLAFPLCAICLYLSEISPFYAIKCLSLILFIVNILRTNMKLRAYNLNCFSASV
ncbi:MAG: hypothetical protein KAR05_11920, partial [Candidatus Omnitrophica bacterium]|nr:hypothetical protein [Candidatus Omnitrophota bacterium]